MPVNGATFDPRLDALYRDGRELLGDAEWFDAHTHIGQNDPDGRKATPEEILGGLDQAGHQRALVFAMHEPDGYGPANDAVLAATAASGGRLVPLARVSPHHEDAVAEAQRCLDAGARGFKLHPRSDEFGLPHPAVERDRRARRRAPDARALPRRPRHPAPRRGGRRPRAALPRRPPDPRPRGHQRPRLDRPRRRRAAEPLLRHRVVAGLRPPPAVRDDPARADPLRERHALRPGAVDGVHLPARRAGGRPRGRRRAQRSRAASSSASWRGRTRSTSARRPASRPSGPG